MHRAIFTFVLFIPGLAIANDKPSWVPELLFGEMTCETSGGNGLIWDDKIDAYKRTNFPSRTTIVQRLDARYSEYSQYDCKAENKPKERLSDRGYIMPACYRYNNTANILGWTMGWCEEKYLPSGEIHVSCDKDSNFQPKIGFSPRGYFYSYGRVRNFGKRNPDFSTIFTEQGRCAGLKKGYHTRFQFAGKEVYYAPVH